MKQHKIAVAIAVIIILVITAFTPGRVVAQCATTVLPNDNSTSQNARAPSTRFAGSRAVYLIKATELAANGYASGQIPASIGWDYQVHPGPAGMAPLKVYLQNTSDTTYSKGLSFAAAIAGMTVVHNATTNLPGVAGTFDIPFSGGSPFTYTGGGLYVAYDWGNYTGTLAGATYSVWCNSTGLAGGLAGANTQADALGASNFRPETRLSSGIQNDAAVAAVYSYGELPQGLVPAQVIKASVANKGALTQTNLPVTLNVSGVDTFTNMQTVASMAGCTGTGSVTFAGFTPGAIGSDTVMASVPSDDVNTNNSMSVPLNITSLSYSYKYPGSTSAGGAGLTGATGAFVGKFNVVAANAVTDVKLEFFGATTTTYRVAIYPDNGFGAPSTTATYVDAADRTVAGTGGPVTITLPSPVAVGPGNFYVGVQQTNTTNASYAFDNEAPIRPGSFYFASPIPVTAWTDFSTTTPPTNFKLNIGLLLQTAGGGTLSVSSAVSRKAHGAAGNFDIALPTTGTAGVECRSGGGTNDYTMIVTFSANVTVSGSPQAQVTSGTGAIGSGGVSNGGTVTVAGNTVTIPLTNVADQQTINVTLNGVNSAAGRVKGAPEEPEVSFVIPMSRLLGDTGGNRSVNASDVTQTKGRIGQAVSSTNFRSDVNANGSINAGDASIVKANTGHAVP